MSQIEYKPATKEQLLQYNVAVKLLKLATAWSELTETSVQLPELDLTFAYPFGQLDFEQLTPAVESWCKQHAANILDNCSIMVRNPQCVIYCNHWREATLHVDNACSESSKCPCMNYPLVPFSATMIRNAIIQIKSHFAVTSTAVPDANKPDEIYDTYISLLELLRRT